MASTTEMKTVLAKMAEMEATLAGLRTMLGDQRPAGSAAAAASAIKKARKPRDPDAPKREPNDWIKFTLRVDALLKGAEKAFKRVADSKKFAAYLKSQKPYAEWADEDILGARQGWEPPAAAASEAGSETGADTEELREELREVGRAALEAGEDVDAALAAHAAKKTGAGGAAAPAAAKKPGRKPMSAEEKAEAKAAREAKLAAMTPAEKEALAAKKAAAKAARAAKRRNWHLGVLRSHSQIAIRQRIGVTSPGL